ncbi:hypothetical protein [Ralstonia pseudosolanacearum]|uniref:hypothetical protein n=1 Tax=Ralstonia pseudosolanacearum TaxID=1310165 RepID=UPI003CE9C63D
MKKSKFALGLLVALSASVMLAACGGGGDDPSAATKDSGPIVNTSPGSSTNPTTPSNPTTPVQGLQVTGSASLVGSQNVSVLFAGTAMHSNGLSGSFLSTHFAAASGQAVTPEGAYTQLAADSGAMTVKLSDVAAIDDVAGNGQYAIGRWSAGSFTTTTPTVNSTKSIAANQGAPYMVGIPLDLYSTTNTGTLNCVYDNSTKPSSITGAVAPGSVNVASSTATINVGTKVVAFNLSINIGADQNVVVSRTSLVLDMLSMSPTTTVMAETVGSDVTKPYLVVAYGTATPSSGDVNGIAVFKCQ